MEGSQGRETIFFREKPSSLGEGKNFRGRSGGADAENFFSPPKGGCGAPGVKRGSQRRKIGGGGGSPTHGKKLVGRPPQGGKRGDEKTGPSFLIKKKKGGGK